jgi:adenosylcobyric acid synthase
MERAFGARMATTKPPWMGSRGPWNGCPFSTQIKEINRPLMSKAPCLAILGTASDVGKSVAVAALCRIFADMGVRVAPFKAQNMSNNSYVTLEGLEMGRAQIVQAEAARIEPTVDMNPVLLKPSGDTTSQVILHGRPISSFKAKEYYQQTEFLFNESLKSLERLRSLYDLVILEGAGSCGEVNLAHRDIVNFRMAHAAEAPVILTADISRGGVFAQLLGTLQVVSEEDRELVSGFLINRFRGDISLFDDGISYLEEQGQRPVLGVIPHYDHIDIDPEDSQSLDSLTDPSSPLQPGRIAIAVIRFPRISNFTDFSPLERDPGVDLHYLTRPRSLEAYDLVLLPGSKNVRADREWLSRNGWDGLLTTYAVKGGRIGGICGGYQILGRIICDPLGVEGPAGETEGFGLLDVETTLSHGKELIRVNGTWEGLDQPVEGYEIHMGRTRCPEGAPVILKNDGQSDGARNPSGRVWGVYLHGLFDSQPFRHAFLESLNPTYSPAGKNETSGAFKDRQYDLLADHFHRHLDLDRLLEITRLKEVLHGR